MGLMRQKYCRCVCIVSENVYLACVLYLVRIFCVVIVRVYCVVSSRNT